MALRESAGIEFKPVRDPACKEEKDAAVEGGEVEQTPRSKPKVKIANARLNTPPVRHSFRFSGKTNY